MHATYKQMSLHTLHPQADEFVIPLSRWVHDSKTAPRFIKYNLMRAMAQQVGGEGCVMVCLMRDASRSCSKCRDEEATHCCSPFSLSFFTPRHFFLGSAACPSGVDPGSPICVFIVFVYVFCARDRSRSLDPSSCQVCPCKTAEARTRLRAACPTKLTKLGGRKELNARRR